MVSFNVFYLTLCIIFYITDISENVKVKINVYPKVLKAGEDIKVECLVFDMLTSDRLKMFFYCPFREKNADYCYADCASICQFILCIGKNKLIDGFKCSWNNSQNTRKFTYHISTISKEQINNQKLLSFSCKYMGLESSENISVMKETYYNTERTVIIKKATKITTTMKIMQDFFNYGVRDIIIIILIVSLLLSFFINIWCCCWCCIKRRKYKKRKRAQYCNNSDIRQQSDDQNTLQMVDYYNQYQTESISKLISDQDAYIRKAKSQPALINNGQQAFIKLSTSNLIKRPGSANHYFRDRPPIYNNSNNEIYPNGFNNEQIKTFAGQQAMRYISPQFMPSQYISPKNDILVSPESYNMNISLSEDLNEYRENDSPNSLQSSMNQMVFRKPNDCLLNKESASSS